MKEIHYMAGSTSGGHLCTYYEKRMRYDWREGFVWFESETRVLVAAGDSCLALTLTWPALG